MNDIVSSTSDKLKLDSELSLGDLAELGKAFKGFSGDQIHQPHAARVLLHDQRRGRGAEARRGGRRARCSTSSGGADGTVTTVPMKVTLTVSNGSGADEPGHRRERPAHRARGTRRPIAADTTHGPDHDGRALRPRHAAPGRPGRPPARLRRRAPGGHVAQGTATVKVVLVTGTDFTGGARRGHARHHDHRPSRRRTSTRATRSPPSTRPRSPSEVGYVDFEPPDGITCG